jgi:hypothetical protein
LSHEATQTTKDLNVFKEQNPYQSIKVLFQLLRTQDCVSVTRGAAAAWVAACTAAAWLSAASRVFSAARYSSMNLRMPCTADSQVGL